MRRCKAQLRAVFGVVLLLALPRVIAETAPRSPNALTHAQLGPGGDDSGAASIRLEAFADTPYLLGSLLPAASQRDVLMRHLEVEEAIAGQPLTSGNQVRLLEDGPNTYRAMFAALRAARHNIHFESYIFDSDDTGKQFASLLMKKRREGLEVALMVDGVGTVSDSEDMFTALRAAGVAVIVFHPLNPLKGSQAYAPNMRDHRKLLVVDDAIGFTGGVNISSVYSSAPSARLIRRRESKVNAEDRDHPSWRDTHVEFTGPAVTELDRLFLQHWQEAGGSTLAASGANEPERRLAPAGQIGAAHLLKVRAASDVKASAQSDVPQSDDAAVIRIVAEDPARANGHGIYDTYLAQLATAVHSIDITMAYFVPDPRLMGVLEGAARRGVEVRLIVPGFTDSWIVLAGGRASYQALLDAGVKIYQRKDALLHAKTAVIDGVWSTVGSSNLDWRSFGLNDEVNAVIIGPQFGAQMTDLFQQDLDAAVPIDPERWKHRSLVERGKEHVALLLQRWL